MNNFSDEALAKMDPESRRQVMAARLENRVRELEEGFLRLKRDKELIEENL